MDAGEGGCKSEYVTVEQVSLVCLIEIQLVILQK